ncbi:hypothetical protein ABW19_dt0209727 [Dactylella cylindrospora]|nr:hypothetical protein ABW19_dt0209727 [Dactylella cylindrospora]
MRFEDESNKSENSTNGASGLPEGEHSNGTSTNGASSRRTGKMKAQSNGNSAFNGQLPPDYFGHDREEVTRLIIQSLYDLGYHDSARQLETESNYPLESDEATRFRDAVENGQWNKVEALLDILELHEDADKNVQLSDIHV